MVILTSKKVNRIKRKIVKLQQEICEIDDNMLFFKCTEDLADVAAELLTFDELKDVSHKYIDEVKKNR